MKTPSPAEFSKVAEEYRNKVVQEEAEKGKPSRPVGLVVATETPSTETVFDAFFSALEQEIVLPVSWLPEVPENHPIRKLAVHVRLWDGPSWKEFGEICALPEEALKKLGFASNGSMLNWWILAVSAVTSAGELLFKQANGLHGSELFSLLPSIAAQYDSPKHAAVTESILETAIEFNGLKKEVANRDAKKPDSIGSSTSSNELSKPEDAPSEKPPILPQKS
jgi:hypothetical protein